MTEPAYVPAPAEKEIEPCVMMLTMRNTLEGYDSFSDEMHELFQDAIGYSRGYDIAFAVNEVLKNMLEHSPEAEHVGVRIKLVPSELEVTVTGHSNNYSPKEGVSFEERGYDPNSVEWATKGRFGQQSWGKTYIEKLTDEYRVEYDAKRKVRTEKLKFILSRAS